jgi:hypothetical protein
MAELLYWKVSALNALLRINNLTLVFSSGSDKAGAEI